MALDNSPYYRLTFAGVPFCLDTARIVRMAHKHHEHAEPSAMFPQKHQSEVSLMDELDKLIPFRYLQEFTPSRNLPDRKLEQLACMKPGSDQPSPTIRVGEWYYPHDATRWSVFRGLATSEQVKAMLAVTSGRIPSTFIMRAAPSFRLGQVTPIGAYTLQTPMYMLPPRPLAEHGGSLDGLFLVTLVDERYWWQEKTISLRVYRESTWLELLAQVASCLGIVITPPTVQAAYSVPEPDSQLWTTEENAAVLLDAIAFNLGCTVVRDLTEGYTLETTQSSLDLVAENRGNALGVLRVAGGDIFNSGRQFLPSSFLGASGDLRISRNAAVAPLVNVTFPKYITGDDPVPHFLNPRYRPSQRPSHHYEDSYGDEFVISVPIVSGPALHPVTPAVSGVFGTPGSTVSGNVHTIHTTAKALYSGESFAVSPLLPTNFSGLYSLAHQLAVDYYEGQTLAALDEVYPGTYNWITEGIHDIIWTYSAALNKATTRVLRHAWNQTLRETQHADPPPHFVASGLLTSGLVLGGAGVSGYIVSGTILSGTTVFYNQTLPRGVGGPSVAQTIRDTTLSGLIDTRLARPLGRTDHKAVVEQIAYLPTQNRWRGKIKDEIVLFEGTSGGISATGLSGDATAGRWLVDIAHRAIDGTVAIAHVSGQVVDQNAPSVTYGVNLTSYEKGQFIYPSDWTSGGVQGVNIVPQIQSVFAFTDEARSLNGILHTSGAVQVYDTTLSSTPFTQRELCWIVHRNQQSLSSGRFYGGQLVGYSASGAVAPVYVVGDGEATGGPSGLHNLLSPTHPDTVPHTPPDRGALVVGDWPSTSGGSSKWRHFPAWKYYRTAVLAERGDGVNPIYTAWRGCPLSSIDNAEMPNITFNANYEQVWGWSLGTGQTAFEFTELGGGGTSVILTAGVSGGLVTLVGGGIGVPGLGGTATLVAGGVGIPPGGPGTIGGAYGQVVVDSTTGFGYLAGVITSIPTTTLYTGSLLNSVLLRVRTRGALSQASPFRVDVRGSNQAMRITPFGETLLGTPVQEQGIRGGMTMEVFRRISAAKPGGEGPFVMLTSYTNSFDSANEFQVWLGLGHVRTFYPFGNVALANPVPHVIGNITYEATSNLRLTGQVPAPVGSPVCQAFNIDATVNTVGPFSYGINARPLFAAGGSSALFASIHASGPLTGEADEAAAIAARGFSGGSGDRNWAFYAVTNGVESRFNGSVLTWECPYRTRRAGIEYTGQTGTGIPIVVHGIVIGFSPGGPGGGGPHTVLNAEFHTDSRTRIPEQGDTIAAMKILGDETVKWDKITIGSQDDIYVVVDTVLGKVPAWNSSKHKLLSGYPPSPPPPDDASHYLEHDDTIAADPTVGAMIVGHDNTLVAGTPPPPGGVIGSVTPRWVDLKTTGASLGNVLTLVNVGLGLLGPRWRPPAAAAAPFSASIRVRDATVGTDADHGIETILIYRSIVYATATWGIVPGFGSTLTVPRSGVYCVGCVISLSNVRFAGGISATLYRNDIGTGEAVMVARTAIIQQDFSAFGVQAGGVINLHGEVDCFIGDSFAVYISYFSIDGTPLTNRALLEGFWASYQGPGNYPLS